MGSTPFILVRRIKVDSLDWEEMHFYFIRFSFNFHFLLTAKFFIVPNS